MLPTPARDIKCIFLTDPNKDRFLVLFRRRHTHGWFWYTFWSLMFCRFLFRFARGFRSSVERPARRRKGNRKKSSTTVRLPW
jgi:hypothetical protein